MTTLDDLAAAAESADARQWWSEPELEMTVGRDARFIAAADPTTILRLVGVAREAQRVAPHIHDETLDAALAALEE